MRVVIAGAGDVGFHLARLLASENQDTILIDTNQDLLDYANSHLDVSTILGDASSPQILERSEIADAELYIAVTTSQTTNIVSCILAKKKGAKQTIARILNDEYLSPENKAMFRDLGIDKLISPNYLATLEIKRLLEKCEVTDIFEFDGGKLSLAGISLDDDSHLKGMTIEQVKELNPGAGFNPMALLRGNRTLIPKPSTRLKRNDHLYFLSEHSQLSSLLEKIGKKHIKVKNVMIVGGSGLAFNTAKELENLYNVSIIDESKERCKELTAKLNNSLIIHANPGNFELLKEEGIEKMDVFLALSPNSETNILTSLMADELGVYKTIALVDNHYYTRISQNIGVDTMINKKITAANYIFRFVRKGTIEAITSLHGVDAEIIEYLIQKESRLTRKPLRKQHFPSAMVIGSVLRSDTVIIPDGDTVLEIGDKVVVLALPRAIQKLDSIFSND